MKPHETKRPMTTQIFFFKNDIEAWLNQVLNIHILRRNSTNRWVDFKTTHQLALGNKFFFVNNINVILWTCKKHMLIYFSMSREKDQPSY